MEHTYEELLAMPKSVDGDKVEFNAPSPGETLSVKLMSAEDLSCKFTMSIYEGKHSSAITLAIDAPRKTQMQTRHRTDVLVRVDIDPRAKHTNPDGEVIEGSHVHIAREGYRDGYAYPLGSREAIMVMGDSNEVMGVFESFREYCNIDRALQVNWSLGI